MIKRYIYLGYRLPDVNGQQVRRSSRDYTIGRVYWVDMSRIHLPAVSTPGVILDDDGTERVFFVDDFVEVPK